MMRKAIVVGVGEYDDIDLNLDNAVNDAIVIKNILAKCNFDVIEVINPNQKELLAAISEYKYALRDYNEVLFYYAGHGFEYEGSNRLTPSDFINKGPQILRTSVEISSLFENSSEDDIAQIFILDACRTRLINTKLRGNVSDRLGVFSAPTGSIVSYATGPDSEASDGDGDNGLFTSVLSKHILTPNLKIEDLLKKVRKEVKNSSNGDQIPWEHSSLIGNFYFVPQKNWGNDGLEHMNDKSENNFGLGIDEDLVEYVNGRDYIKLKNEIDSKLSNKSFEEYYIISKTKTLSMRRNLVQWWAAERQGYCEKISDAGVYHPDELGDIIEIYNRSTVHTKSLAIPKTIADRIFEYDIVPYNEDLFELLYKNEEFIIGELEFELPRTMY